MKRLLLDRIAVICKAMVGVLVLSAAAVAAPTGKSDFNHLTTGFPLSGAHVVAVCETCHVGGVFKGTPKNCDGCHALGKRVVATPKSNSHIVTDAPCENCHFNTATFLGARFNHATARPGDCATCHNGRISQGKHSAHVVTAFPCDQCHRTSSWIPASWNHTNNALATYSGQSCVTCHISTGMAKNKIQSASHLPLSMAGITFADCNSCHKSYYSFYTAFYDHAGAPATCQSCHGTYGAPAYTNVKSPTALIHSAVVISPPTVTCSSCHKSFGTFSGAKFDHLGATQCSVCHSGAYASSGIRGKTASHTRTGMATYQCSDCHNNFTTWLPAIYKHTAPSPTGRCDGCHDGVIAVSTAAKPGHAAIGTDDCIQCHTSTATWLGALGGKPANHIPYNTGTTCSACHTGTTVATGATLHAVVSTTCKTCHNSSPVYLGSMQRKTIGSHEGSKASDDCISCHARQYNQWNNP